MGLFSKKEVVEHKIPAPPPLLTKKEIALPEAPAAPVLGESGAQAPSKRAVPPPPKIQDAFHIPDITFEKEEKHDVAAEHPLVETPAKPEVLQGPPPQALYVGTTDYETILDGVEKIKHNLGETEGHIARILELKQRQERIVEEWKNQLEDVQKKLSYIDEVIFKVQ